MPVCACASVYVKHWFPGNASPFSGDLTTNAKALQSSCSTHRLAQSWIVICSVTEALSRSVGWRPLDRKTGVMKQSSNIQHVVMVAAVVAGLAAIVGAAVAEHDDTSWRTYRLYGEAWYVIFTDTLYVMHDLVGTLSPFSGSLTTNAKDLHSSSSKHRLPHS